MYNDIEERNIQQIHLAILNNELSAQPGDTVKIGKYVYIIEAVEGFKVVKCK